MRKLINSLRNTTNSQQKEVKPMKKLIVIFAMSLFTIALSSSAFALSVSGLFETAPTNTLLSDNSADLFINVDGSVGTVGLPTITVGDIIVTMIGINTIGPTTIGSGTNYNEVTAFIATRVTAASNVDLGPLGPDDSFGSQNIDLWQFVEAPLTAAEASYFNWATGEINFDGVGAADLTFTPVGSNDGTFFGAVYEDAAQNYNRDAAVQTGITSATDGDLRLALGLVDANGDFLAAVAPVDLGQILTIPLSTAIDGSNIALDGTIINQYWPGLFFNDNFTGGNGGFSSPTLAGAQGGWPALTTPILR